MNYWKLATLTVLVAAVQLASRAADAPEGFKSLFNGKDLSGWEGDDKLWVAENGEIVGKSPGIKKNEFLASTESFRDFVMVFKFKIVNNPKGDANSGMMFRSKRIPNSREMFGYQADVGMSGGQSCWGWLYDESRRNKGPVKK